MEENCPVCDEPYITAIEKFEGNFTTYNEKFRFRQRWGKDYYLHSSNNLDNQLYSKINDLDKEDKKEIIEQY